MSCSSQCYVIGGPWIAEDPNCPIHGVDAQRESEIREEERRQQEEDDAERDERLEALEESLAAMQKMMGWKKVADGLPQKGMIVKKFKNGSVWAGFYSGTEKESAFVEYIQLPP
jgi:hypothetical protein